VSCSYSCANGYFNGGGSLTRTCNATGTWSGTELLCYLNPPTIKNHTVAVYENATADATVGDPIVAEHGGLDVAVTYLIVGGDDPARVFKIGLCNGQVRVSLPVLDVYVKDTYTLEVEARANSQPTSAARANVTVKVMGVPHPPRFNDTSGRTVTENVPNGTLILPCARASDPDSDPLVFSKGTERADNSPAIAVNASGCMSVVAPINYEQTRFVRPRCCDRCCLALRWPHAAVHVCVGCLFVRLFVCVRAVCSCTWRWW
jgi:hypothetical protein